ncbi:MAG: oligosaccharide flippase family protein [Raineya sp.]|nr:oligosaccharide flippase family protein [Raineya sp.]MDW8296971.1 oligosaccharide flippase family protein [Raineya sp.]
MEHKSIFKNFFHLGLLQITNYLLPLLLIPYLIRVLGEENFGKISFAQAILGYFAIIVDYGFNLSATRNVVACRDDKTKLTEIFNNVLFTKLFLAFLTFLLLLLLLLFFPKIRQESFLYITGFSIVLGQALLPVWFYQGIEKMQFLTYTNLINKIITFIGIIVFVKQNSDYQQVLFFYGLGGFLAGVISLIHIKRSLGIKIQLTTWQNIYKELQKGVHIFLSYFTVSFYINLHLIILGIFTNDLIVGYYSIAEKIVYMFRVIIITFNQAVQPYLYSIAQQMQKLFKFFSGIYLIFAVTFLLITIIAFFNTEWILWIIKKDFNTSINQCLKLIIFVPFITILHLPTGGMLLIHQKDKDYSKAIVVTSIVSLLLNIPASIFFHELGVAAVSVFLEVLVLILFIQIIRKKYPEYDLIQYFFQKKNFKNYG